MSKIMLVEDDNNLREIYGTRLQAEGHEIVAAKDGEEALALAVKEKPDLIISDVMMPRISGFDMLDILRNAPETKDTKVIMMTALSQAEDKARADKLGADRYLVKSQVTLEDVAKVVRDVLDGHSQEESNKKVAEVPAPPAITTPATVGPVVTPATPAPTVVTSPVPDVAPAVTAPPPSATDPAVAAPAAMPVDTPAVSAADPPPVQATPPVTDPSTSPPASSEDTTTVAAPAAPVEQADTTIAGTPETSEPPIKSPELAAVESLLRTPPTTTESSVPPASTVTSDSATPAGVVLPTPPDEIVETPEPAAIATDQTSVKAEEPRPSAGLTLEQALIAADADNNSGPETALSSEEPTEKEPKTEVSASAAETDTALLDQVVTPSTAEQENTNRNKKVIQPINDPAKKPDFDALLAAEEKKAAVINPSAGSNITPAPQAGSTPANDKHDEISL